MDHHRSSRARMDEDRDVEGSKLKGEGDTYRKYNSGNSTGSIVRKRFWSTSDALIERVTTFLKRNLWAETTA